MRLAHAREELATLRPPSVTDPWRVLVSGCLAGWPCGVDGTDYGMAPRLADLRPYPQVLWVPFCPEDAGIGTPRTMPDIHGGDGFDVLDGRARVVDERGADLTSEMVSGAHAMLEHARAHDVELAILTDMSAACGSQVISDGCRLVPQSERRYRRGVGVGTALLLRAGVPVVSQRDYATLGHLRALLDPSFVPDPDARDHHESAWFVSWFAP